MKNFVPQRFPAWGYAPPDFRFPAPKPQTLTGKWCANCAKDNHDDAECWSTRSTNP